MPQPTLDRNRSDLATFVRDRREALNPVDVGLPAAGRRRTPGLRREEVAALAGVGLTWYTWFEQGRDVTVSNAFLQNVARALRLDAAEHTHLFSLAGHGEPARARGTAQVPKVITELIAGLADRPAFIKDARWDILAWNAACTAVFGDFNSLPAMHRNSLWLTFADARYRGTMVNWESDARRMLGRFRADHARNAKDARFLELVARLERESPEFRRLWRDYEVLDRDTGMRMIDVKGIGPTPFSYTVMAIEGTRGLKLVLYSPEKAGANGKRFVERMLRQKGSE